MTDLAALLHPSVCGKLTGLRHDGMVTPWCELLAANLHERGLTVVPETALAVVAAAEAWQRARTAVHEAGEEMPIEEFGFLCDERDEAIDVLMRAVDAHRAAEAVQG